MPTGERVDPYRSFNFRVEGLEVASFSEVSGLSSDGDAVDYREGTDVALSVRKLPGLRKYGNVTLKRGVTQSLALWSWYQNIINGISDRRNCTVVLQNEEHTDVIRWNLENAYVNKYEVSALNATANEVTVETVELVHEGLTVEAA
ncbi:MAG TPA: phage tail protein [Longimicrobiaceae bacterium]|nr:phage tail protein [Longimicrobiaceae bacterium]